MLQKYTHVLTLTLIASATLVGCKPRQFNAQTRSLANTALPSGYKLQDLNIMWPTAPLAQIKDEWSDSLLKFNSGEPGAVFGPVEGGKGALYPAPLFTQLHATARQEALRIETKGDLYYTEGAAAGRYMDSVSNPARWNIVAIRVIPCLIVPKIVAGIELVDASVKVDPEIFKSSCKSFVRVVAQFGKGSTDLPNFDSNMHFIYAIPTDEVVPLVNAFRQVREQYEQPGADADIYDVHSIFKAHDMSKLPVPAPHQSDAFRDMAQHNRSVTGALWKTLGKHIGIERLESVEMFFSVGYAHQPGEKKVVDAATGKSTDAAGTASGIVAAWMFQEFKKGSDGQFKHHTNHFVQDKALRHKMQVNRAKFAHDGTKQGIGKLYIPTLRDSSTHSNVVDLTAFALAPTKQLPLTEALKAALDKSYAVENPLKNNIASTDCASCHLAGNLRMAVLEQLSQLDRAKFDAWGYPLQAYISEFPSVFDLSGNPNLRRPKNQASDQMIQLPYQKQFFGEDNTWAHERFQRYYIQRHSGYFGRHREVSRTVANDAALALKIFEALASASDLGDKE